ncbi:thioredoxin family protein [Chitinimonas sp. BJB300]|uniref:thioredoxin family protein n=1 Tax=Chitinimonas sp. BJB300 TaxID=1559339 RepID=UPI000C1203B4|nr:thioredoxin family protein [Chitinimonas sp. BJB300]PHV13283.1 thiol reductase thioredoxin [Chitinimonas sp. BJB300]TSJ86013.1 thioredoxin family protein [Chitinimonas sp. BJB300]
MKKLIALVLMASSLTLLADALPYDESANAKEEVKQALIKARKTQTPVLLVFGANWCEDCRALDRALKNDKNAALMAKSFNVVKIDVGRFDKNTDLDTVYGNPIKKGIPAVVVLAPDQRVLYATRAGELANARQMNADGVYGFFQDIVAKAGKPM